MVHVIDLAALTEVGSNILVILQGMLDMGPDQRHDSNRLGHHK
jgi:hypothetical protein